jgi:acetoacetate decarboxylase
VKVTATLSYRHRTVQHGDTNDDCCEPNRMEWLGTVDFSPKIQTVTFPPAPDASADAPFMDAAQDGPLTMDATLD